MTILLIGGGGREHALGRRLAQDPSCTRLVSAPGNPGLAALGETRAVSVEDGDGILALAREIAADLVVVGPEAPLAAGLADRLIAAEIPVFGPTRAAAELEASKSFMKAVADAAGAPTAHWARFEDPEAARAHLRERPGPYVVKADGLAAGKGVVVSESLETAEAAVDACFDGAFGSAGATIVIEEFLTGEEASLFALVDGETVVPLAGAQDHKRAFDGDEGPNTGGMGAYSPTPVLDPESFDRALDAILRPVAREMVRRGTPFQGLLYAGLMVGAGEPKLIEFNVRFGDPEAQVVLPLIEGDLTRAFMDVAHGRLAEGALNLKKDAAAAVVVLAAKGYPGAYEKGSEVRGVAQAEARDGVHVIHAGTRAEGERLFANGGRVLGVVGEARTAGEAVARAYDGVAAIDWPEGFHRTDIGKRVRERTSS